MRACGVGDGGGEKAGAWLVIVLMTVQDDFVFVWAETSCLRFLDARSSASIDCCVGPLLLLLILQSFQGIGRVHKTAVGINDSVGDGAL